MIDTTLWTVDPFGQTGSEHLSLLIGRPIAVVRAELRLDVRSDVDDYPGLGPDAKAARGKRPSRRWPIARSTFASAH